MRLHIYGMTLLLLLVGLHVSHYAEAASYLHAPSTETYAKHDPEGLTILSNGRFLKPVGRHFPLAKWPHGMAMSPDGETLFIASSGTGQFLTGWRGAAPVVQQIQPPTKGPKERRLSSGAVDFSPDGRSLYWSSGEGGSVHIFDVATKEPVGEIPVNVEVAGVKYTDSFVVDVKASSDGRHVYGADVTNFRVVVLDSLQRRVVGSVQVGRYPYALSLVGDRLYVANIGLFEYKPVPPPDDKRFDPRGLTTPPFGYPRIRETIT